MIRENDFKKQNYTVIGINNSIEGDLNLTGDTIIHSKVKGTITIFGDGKLVIERTSEFEGTIYCNDIEVFGIVKGSIKSAGALTIRSSANISGNISAQKMSIYPGAVLNIEGHTDDQMESVQP